GRRSAAHREEIRQRRAKTVQMSFVLSVPFGSLVVHPNSPDQAAAAGCGSLIRPGKGATGATSRQGFFFAFAHAADAVAAAVAAQRALAAHSWPAGVRVRARMGLHTGAPALTEAGYVGLDVHRAARIKD